MNRKQIKRIRGTLRMIASQVVRSEVLKLYKCMAPAKNKKGKVVDMVHHPCAKCTKLFRPDEVELDHIEEVGEFRVSGPLKNTVYGDCKVENWQEWMDRLFCNISNFQVLCIRCHQEKTLDFNSGTRNKRLKSIERYVLINPEDFEFNEEFDL